MAERGFTARELEVVACLAAGMSRKAIAKELGIGIKTVDTLLDRARQRLPPGPGSRRWRLMVWYLVGRNADKPALADMRAAVST